MSHDIDSTGPDYRAQLTTGPHSVERVKRSELPETLADVTWSLLGTNTPAVVAEKIKGLLKTNARHEAVARKSKRQSKAYRDLQKAYNLTYTLLQKRGADCTTLAINNERLVKENLNIKREARRGWKPSVIGSIGWMMIGGGITILVRAALESIR